MSRFGQGLGLGCLRAWAGLLLAWLPLARLSLARRSFPGLPFARLSLLGCLSGFGKGGVRKVAPFGRSRLLTERIGLRVQCLIEGVESLSQRLGGFRIGKGGLTG